jgi:hypothetical protein
MLEQQLLAEFDRRLRADTAEKLSDAEGSSRLDEAARRFDQGRPVGRVLRQTTHPQRDTAVVSSNIF